MHPSGNPTDLSPSMPALVEMQKEVREHFGWDESEDINSAERLLRRVESSQVAHWSRHYRDVALSKLYRRLVLREAKVAIIGAAIEPEEVHALLDGTTMIVAADGAAGVISELPRTVSEKAWSRVSCVVSDGDGGDGTLLSVRRAIPIILHAHGDNRDDWSHLIDYAESQTSPPELVLTHQTTSAIPGMHNPGGFTDGDRAACFLTALGVRRGNIRISGARTDIVGRWSGSTHQPTKIEKLQWMEKSLRIQGLWDD